MLFNSSNGIPISRDKGNRARGETLHSYSKICVRLAAYFEGVGPQDKLMWFGTFEKTDMLNERMKIRPEINAALKALGWV